MGALLAERSMLAVAWQGLVGLLQGVHSLLLVGHPLGHQVDCWEAPYLQITLSHKVRT